MGKSIGVGTKIKELAELKEINLKELSRKADVSYNTLYAIVQRDNKSVRPDILIRIAKALSVKPSELIGIDEEIRLENIKIMQVKDLSEYTTGELLEEITRRLNTSAYQ